MATVPLERVLRFNFHVKRVGRRLGRSRQHQRNKLSLGPLILRQQHPAEVLDEDLCAFVVLVGLDQLLSGFNQDSAVALG